MLPLRPILSDMSPLPYNPPTVSDFSPPPLPPPPPQGTRLDATGQVIRRFQRDLFNAVQALGDVKALKAKVKALYQEYAEAEAEELETVVEVRGVVGWGGVMVVGVDGGGGGGGGEEVTIGVGWGGISG